MNENTPKIKKQVDRSPAYPSIDLKQAIDICCKIFDLFSEYSFSREVASEKLGLPSNAVTFRKIAALVQYGLLKREGNSYKITALSKEIALATDETEKRKSLAKAAQQPKIFSRLINENIGKGLPASLDTRLRQLEYSKDAAKSLSDIFKRSLEYSSILSNGIVTNLFSESVDNQDGESANGNIDNQFKMLVGTPSKDPKSDTISQAIPGINSDKYIPYPLDCGILVMFPFSMVKKMMSGVFKDKLEELETLGKDEKDGNPTSNVANASVESN